MRLNTVGYRALVAFFVCCGLLTALTGRALLYRPVAEPSSSVTVWSSASIALLLTRNSVNITIPRHMTFEELIVTFDLQGARAELARSLGIEGHGKERLARGVKVTVVLTHPDDHQ